MPNSSQPLAASPVPAAGDKSPSSPIASVPAAWLLLPAMALLLLSPFFKRDLRSDGDLPSTTFFMTEASRGLAEGQFPLRVAPTLFGGARYPLFQFYGNLPLTLGGALARLPGLGAYDAWRMLMFAAVLCGATYAYRCGTLLAGRGTRGRTSATLAAAAFMTAPYLMTDVFPRGAFAEAVAFNLLPSLLFYTLRALLRPGVRHVLAMALAWTLLGLTHNITYLYGSTFLAALVLSLARPTRGYARRLARVAAAGALHGALLAWYFVPQWALLPKLFVTFDTRASYQSLDRARVPLWRMLVPWKVPLPHTEGLGVQIGWPLLAGAIGASVAAFRSAWRRPQSGGAERHGHTGLRGRETLLRAMAIRLGVLMAVATFMAWSPFDFWRWLPPTFRFVQYPYRLLVFVSTFAALMVPIAAWFFFPRGMRPWQLSLWMLAVGLTAAAHRPATPWAMPALSGDATIIPRWRPAPDYLIAPTYEHPPLETVVSPDVGSAAFGRHSRFALELPSERRIRLPVFYYPGALRVRLDGTSVAYESDDGYAALTVPPGRHEIEAWFAGTAWANGLSATAWVLVVAIGIASLAMRPPWRRRTVHADATEPARAPPPVVRTLRRHERRAAWSAIAAMAAGLLTPGVVTWFLGFLPPPPLPPAAPPRHPAPAAEVSSTSPGEPQMTKPQVVYA